MDANKYFLSDRQYIKRYFAPMESIFGTLANYPSLSLSFSPPSP